MLWLCQILLLIQWLLLLQTSQSDRPVDLFSTHVEAIQVPMDSVEVFWAAHHGQVPIPPAQLAGNALVSHRANTPCVFPKVLQSHAQFHPQITTKELKLNGDNVEARTTRGRQNVLPVWLVRGLMHITLCAILRPRKLDRLSSKFLQLKEKQEKKERKIQLNRRRKSFFACIYGEHGVSFSNI